MAQRQRSFDQLLAGARSGEFTRRQVLTRAAAGALSLGALPALLVACGGTATPTTAPVSAAPAATAASAVSSAAASAASASTRPASAAPSAAPSAAASAAGGTPKRGGILKVGLQ